MVVNLYLSIGDSQYLACNYFQAGYNPAMDLDTAVRHFGSKRRLALALGLHPQAVYQWGDRIPPLRQYQIAELIGKAKAGEDGRKPKAMR